MPTLLYDGECSLCRRAVAWVRERDLEHVVELLPFQDSSTPARFPEVPRAQCLRAAQFVDDNGSVASGAAAVREIFRRLPRMRWLGQILTFPPFFAVARLAYWLVARTRPRDSCSISLG